MDSKKHSLYEIPEPSTDSVTDASLQLLGRVGVIRFDYYRNDTTFRSAIRFSGVVASRTRSERCCTAWHIDGAYDTLAEVSESSWIEEIIDQTQERYRAQVSVRHFIIYLDSVGCFELLAEDFEVAPEEMGSWGLFRRDTLS